MCMHFGLDCVCVCVCVERLRVGTFLGFQTIFFVLRAGLLAVGKFGVCMMHVFNSCVVSLLLGIVIAVDRPVFSACKLCRLPHSLFCVVGVFAPIEIHAANYM